MKSARRHRRDVARRGARRSAATVKPSGNVTLVYVSLGGVRSRPSTLPMWSLRAELVVAGRELEPAVVLDVPAEHAGVDDEALRPRAAR